MMNHLAINVILGLPHFRVSHVIIVANQYIVASKDFYLAENEIEM
jgi:hypothetical protein